MMSTSGLTWGLGTGQVWLCRTTQGTPSEEVQTRGSHMTLTGTLVGLSQKKGGQCGLLWLWWDGRRGGDEPLGGRFLAQNEE